jgi:hypothetical protein
MLANNRASAGVPSEGLGPRKQCDNKTIQMTDTQILRLTAPRAIANLRGAHS